MPVELAHRRDFQLHYYLVPVVLEQHRRDLPRYYPAVVMVHQRNHHYSQDVVVKAESMRRLRQRSLDPRQQKCSNGYLSPATQSTLKGNRS